jgi:TRAP-type mannitol/chloroaromatic compound transport system permease small subunit
MDKILDGIDRFNTVLGRATGVLVFFVAAAIVYEIVVRHVFNRPTIWANESTVFACCIVYMLGGAWAMLEDRHVRIDVFYHKFSPRNRAIVDLCMYPVFCLYIIVMLWVSTNYAWESIKVRETTMSPWDPPIYPMKIVMTLGLILLLIQGTVKLLRDILLLTARKSS